MILFMLEHWNGGMFDVHSELVKVSRNYELTSELGNGKKGMAWKVKYGFVGINFENMSYYMDGMNEAGLAVGGFLFSGFYRISAV